MNTSHDIKPPNQSRTGSQHQQDQQKQDQPSDRQPPAMVHSTHSYLETFDQATRDQLQEQESKASSLLDQDHPLANKQSASAVDSELGFQEANSGVQLDRDVQRSRRVADESKQKASGSGREGSWSGNQGKLPYVE
ncbi:hypothetical protein BGZ70_001632 [Mortierella alpina]|uniref:Uncharacterized protein n=1 Tax=Mortierella alpina TaxID=64518 RepID=A0A9P6IVK6_MORAP|nr:hypothetical protein BGZ70_001632 [Mortierella alpina]